MTIPLSLGWRRDGLRRRHRLAGLGQYKPPFTFTGTIHGVTVDVSGELIKDHEAEAKMAMARQ